ncbi:MAG: thioredoxin [Planctomycetes bacterium]|nr:thioredoxin [Planctomycetota bacterium]
MSNIDAVTSDEFDQVVLQSKVPILVDFFAIWCGPCKTLSPILDELSVDFDGRVKFVKADIDAGDNKELAVKYGIMSVPTLLIFSNGEVKETIVGVTGKSKLKKTLEDLL